MYKMNITQNIHELRDWERKSTSVLANLPGTSLWHKYIYIHTEIYIYISIYIRACIYIYIYMLCNPGTLQNKDDASKLSVGAVPLGAAGISQDTSQQSPRFLGRANAGPGSNNLVELEQTPDFTSRGSHHS